ncbi:MAG: glycosyltransferase family 39 protein [Synechococcaceae cyanobacterium]
MASLPWGWWLALGGLWLLSTALDRVWLGLDARLPAWDQADYLNSAVDHGRALGLLAGGGWPGWAGLLDLSPKIPPLASLVNGTMMAVAGQEPDAASWALALWQGLLLVVVALWGRQLQGPGLGLLAAALVALAPALADLRVDFTLDLPLAATSTLALWRLGCWQAPSPAGGRPAQALGAALAVAAAILVKQSALLVVALPCLWAAGQGLRQRGRRWQVLLALAVVLALLLPWLHHNWISTLGGTNRAVIESATQEGDPAPLSVASLLWYLRLWPAQLGTVTLLAGLVGAMAGLQRWRPWRQQQPRRRLSPPWGWLLGCAIAGWLATTLSPNKDPRYITPVLPLLSLLLARGWWLVGTRIAARWGRPAAIVALAGGLLGAGGGTLAERASAIARPEGFPLPEAMAALREQVGQEPTTVLLVASRPDFNEHTATVYGRLAGGQLVARQVGRRSGQQAKVLAGAQWLLLATGDQGSGRPSAQELSRAVREDGRFERVRHWSRRDAADLELWRRRRDAPPARSFTQDFQRMAPRLADGPAALAPVFASIGLEHQLDGHRLYQQEVAARARQRLAATPGDPDALWNLALLATLQNRPDAAERWFGELQRQSPSSPWPAAYRAIVLLADWRPWQARAVLDAVPAKTAREPLILGLRDLSGLLSGELGRLDNLPRSLPQAVAAVKREISRTP